MTVGMHRRSIRLMSERGYPNESNATLPITPWPRLRILYNVS